MDLSDPPGSEPNPEKIDRSRLLLALLFVLAVIVAAFAFVQQADLREAADARATAESDAQVTADATERAQAPASPDDVVDQPARNEPRRQLLTQLRTPMFEREGQILAASLSPDARRIATAGDDGTPRIWDVESGDLLAELSGHADPVRVAHFSPDGSLLVTADDDGGMELWDGVTFQNLASVEVNISAVRAADFSPDGTSLLTAGDDGRVRIWRISVEAPGAATLSADLVLESRNDRITTAAFSPDGSRIVAAGNDGLARIWDAHTGTALADLDGHDAQINSAAFSPDGARVATAGANGVVRIWDVSTAPPAEPFILNAHDGPVHKAAFYPDGLLLVTAGCDEQNIPCQTASARAWDAETGELLTEWLIDSPGVTSANLSPDGQHLLTIGADGLVQLASIHLNTILEHE